MAMPIANKTREKRTARKELSRIITIGPIIKNRKNGALKNSIAVHTMKRKICILLPLISFICNFKNIQKFISFFILSFSANVKKAKY